MLPINNSDTAWLIVADYNQDNSIGYPDCLREDILNPNIDQWSIEHYMIMDKTAGTPLARSHVGEGFKGLMVHGGNSVGDIGHYVGGNFASATAVGGYGL